MNKGNTLISKAGWVVLSFAAVFILVMVRSDQPASATISGALVIIALLAVYMLPTLIAQYREHHNANAILVLNLFLGWTLIGWVVALVWANTDNRKVQL